jgi:BirA family biotin operon repressor/biotin-[acetyl-CoA-carboxylase] ligase
MFDVVEFQKLRKGSFGKDLYYFETLDSTNVTAGELAQQNVAEGTVVLANEQTGGKGRMDRSWFSPADLNLYFSLILRPASSRLHYIPFLAALSVHDTLQTLGVDADVKWPNDVLVGGKKLAGILMRTSTEQNALRYAILGIGINVNIPEFPPDLARTATSIALEMGGRVGRESVLASVLLEFERPYQTINDLEWTDLCSELERSSSYLRGCPVQVKEHDRFLEGRTAGLDKFGGLILETADGEKIVYAGDVESCRKN